MTDQMNLVLVVIDSLRQDCVEAYGPTVGREWFGTDVLTPSLSTFAESATTFANAYPEALPTIPFRRSIATGRRVFPFHGYRPVKWDFVYMPGWQPIDEDVDTLAEALARAGYRTGYVSDCMPVFNPSMNFHRGFQHFHFIRGQQQDRWQSLSHVKDLDLSEHIVSDDYRARLEGMIAQYKANTLDRLSEEDWFAPKVFRQATRFLEEHAHGDPFFLMIDCWDPHEPWDPPHHYVDLYNPGYEGKNPIHPYYGFGDWCTPHELRQMRANYCGEATMVDRWLGNFLSALDALDLRSTTAVAVISDHGHSLGDRGVTGKVPPFQHPELVDLVLMLRHPDGVGAGGHRDEFVYNIDVITTLAAWGGVDLTTNGRDLTPLLTGDPWEERPYVTYGFSQWATCQDRSYKLTRGYAEGGPLPLRLFDLNADPGETKDVASEHPDVVEELTARILDDAGGNLPVYESVPHYFADGSRPRR